MRIALIAVAAVFATYSSAQSTRPSHETVICETGRPVGCTENPPPNCPLQRTQRWLPQSNIGVPAACGSCYYCRERPIVVEKEACPIEVCPEISPLCNDVQSVIIEHDGRRCRGCSECVSYNQCPTLNCPRRIRGCELYGPNYVYTNGQLCQDCEVCMRYKGDFVRPPMTPLPCPVFNISECPLVAKCLRYQEKFVNMGEDRTCQVCPECLEWADPNEGIPSFTLGGGGSEPIAASEIEACDPDINCHRSSSCETFEVVYRIRNSSACRDCDRCTQYSSVTITDGGNDGVPTPAIQPTQSPPTPAIQPTQSPPTPAIQPTQSPPTPAIQPTRQRPTTTQTAISAAGQSCPDLTFCPSVEDCTTRVVNRTMRISTNEICESCPVCVGDNSQCQALRCPGAWCTNTAVYTLLVSGDHCGTCVCTDPNQDCSNLSCPQLPPTCSQTVNTSLIVEDHICQCEVCDRSTRLPAGVDGGADQTAPDVRDNLPNVAVELVQTTRATQPPTTEMPTTEALPNCETIMPELQCGLVDCFLVFADILTVDGVDCLGCSRCASGIQPRQSCPEINCPTQNCGDTEDVAAGRRYREAVTYNISGESCPGCDRCLDCPVLQCPPLNPSCQRYARRTDPRGCIVCPVCEVWESNGGPAITERHGFLQSMSTSMCLTANGNFSNNLPGLVVDTCSYDVTELANQKQVWSLSAQGLLMDAATGLCAGFFSSDRPFVMRICNRASGDMLWQVETDNRYPQFFRFRLPYRGDDECMDVVGNSLQVANTPLALWSCEEFQRYGGIWSDQWWKFEEFLRTPDSAQQ